MPDACPPAQIGLSFIVDRDLTMNLVLAGRSRNGSRCPWGLPEGQRRECPGGAGAVAERGGAGAPATA